MTNFKRTMKKAAAVTLALAMVLSLAPAASAKSKVKKPTINKKTASIQVGKKVTLKVKKGTYKIKSVKWTSLKKSIATVKKSKKATSAVVTGKKVGNATIKAVVTTKKSSKKTKKYTLTSKIKVKAAPEPVEPAWVTATDPVVPDDLKLKIVKYNEGMVGAKFTPLAVLATQEGAGTNYRLLVEEDITTQEPKSFYGIVEVFVGNDGDIYKVNYIASTESIFDVLKEDEPECQPLYGEYMVIPDTVKPLIDDYIEKNAIPYKPLAIVAKEPGTDIFGHYLVICEVAVEDGHTGYVMLTLNLSGNLPTPDIDFDDNLIPFSFDPSLDVYKTATKTVQPCQVDQVAALVRYSLLSKDFRGIASFVKYPIDVDGQTIENEQQMIDYFESFNMDDEAEKAVFDEPCTGMFDNANGIMFAGGLIWLNEEGDDVKVTDIYISPVNTWVTENDPTVDEEMEFFFKELNKMEDESKYEPVAVLAHKNCAGEDKVIFRVLTKRSEIGENATNSTAKYVVLEFSAYGDNVNPEQPFFSDPLTDVYPAKAEDGGFEECEDVSLSADEKAIFNEAIKKAINPNGLTVIGAPTRKVVAKVAQQVVEGTNYCVIVEEKAMVQDAEPSYFLININVDLAGKVTGVDTTSKVNFSEVVPS